MHTNGCISVQEDLCCLLIILINYRGNKYTYTSLPKSNIIGSLASHGLNIYPSIYPIYPIYPIYKYILYSILLLLLLFVFVFTDVVSLFGLFGLLFNSGVVVVLVEYSKSNILLSLQLSSDPRYLFLLLE